MPEAENSSPFYPRDWEATLAKAKQLFSEISEEMLGETVYVYKKSDLNLVPGARTTAILPLSGFIELFGDLVEAEDYSLNTYWQRNLREGFGIPGEVFEDWQRNTGLRE